MLFNTVNGVKFRWAKLSQVSRVPQKFSCEYLCFIKWRCLSIFIRKDLQPWLAIICLMKLVPYVERYLLLFKKLIWEWYLWLENTREAFPVLKDTWRAESADSKLRSWKWNHRCFSIFCIRLLTSRGWKREYLNELAKKKRSGEELLVKSLQRAK